MILSFFPCAELSLLLRTLRYILLSKSAPLNHNHFLTAYLLRLLPFVLLSASSARFFRFFFAFESNHSGFLFCRCILFLRLSIGSFLQFLPYCIAALIRRELHPFFDDNNCNLPCVPTLLLRRDMSSSLAKELLPPVLGALAQSVTLPGQVIHLSDELAPK